MQEPSFSWHHVPGYVALMAVGVRYMFQFLEKIWPKNGSAAKFELKLGEVVREAVKPLSDDIKQVNEKLDKHIQWHLERGA